jgi:hypothetical protein
MVLARDTIIIDSKEYPLARMKNVQGVLGTSARRWSATRKPLTAGITPRENVQRGEMPDEYVITYNDWSKGITGDHDPQVGKFHLSTGVCGYFPGRLVSMPYVTYVNFADAPPSSNIVYGFETFSIVFDGHLYTFVGEHVYKDGGTTAVKDFSSGNNVKDAIVWNNELVVCFGSTKVIAKMSTAGVWDETGDVYANYFAVVEDRLWRAYNVNEVSNIATTDDPQDSTKWSAVITVGDDDVPITDLNGYGERLAVSKEDGLYLGDSNALFPNVLPQLISARDARNGIGTVSIGTAALYYPCSKEQVLEYTYGAVTDVGLGTTSLSGVRGDSDIGTPGNQVGALATYGQQLYLVTVPMHTMRDPDGVLKTTDNGGTYTSYLTQTTDNSLTTVADISSLDAVDDYIYIGSSEMFTGLDLRIKTANTTETYITASYYGSGGWNPISVIDETNVSGCPFSRSGRIYFANYTATLVGGWDKSVINGSDQLYWIRLNVAHQLSADVKLSEIRLCGTDNYGYVYRGEKENGKVVWSGIGIAAQDYPATHALVVGPNVWPYAAGGALIISSGNWVQALPLPSDQANEWEPMWMYGDLVMPKDDAGMPHINKQWLDVTVRGKTIDASHTVDVYYREDETTTWDALVSNMAASPTTTALTSITAKALQLRFHYDLANSDIPTEINEVQLRFRLLDTLKTQIEAYLEIYDGLVPAATQLTALRALVGAGPKSITDPLGTARTVTFTTVDETEYISEGVDYPAMLVRVVCTET